mmetsp:Transcript_38724/g.82374  ORF Transcript_38724/g.82374 Transcript_38724/m.82374 type:complete len:375 (+) Transcript_38724:98-1222(+)
MTGADQERASKGASLSFRMKFAACAVFLLTVQMVLSHVYDLFAEPLHQDIVLEGSRRGRQSKEFYYDDEPLFVFMHVPRTGGDSMRAHLFPDVNADDSRLWPSSFTDNDQTFFNNGDLHMANAPWTHLIKGFYSLRDYNRIQRRKRYFVFLRHPIERILSLHAVVQPRKNIRYKNGTQPRSMPYSAAGMVERGNKWQWACTFTHDAMTWQFGDQQHCSVRSNITADEVLANAKRTLLDADFVGFYETLDTDFWRLKRELFPRPNVAFYLPLLFRFRSLLSLPRLRVMRFSQSQSKEDLEVIREANQLDLALYEWARERFRPNLVLYESYSGFVEAYAPALVTTGLFSAAFLLACCCWCRARQPAARNIDSEHAA